MTASITIQEGTDSLKIEVNRFAYSDATDLYDKNWIDVTITLKTGSFSGKYSAYFQTTDLQHLHDELITLHKNLTGEFTFSTLERQLELHFKGDGIGHIEISGIARDSAGIGNTLNFELNIDQTSLPSLIQETHNVIKEFPFKQ